jgi:cytochrome c
MEYAMINRSSIKILLPGILSMVVSFAVFADEPIDADAAIKLARSQSCLRCHSVSKKKEGPSYASVAKVYKGDKDAEDTIYKQVTETPKVKLSDGHKELHKAVQNMSKEQIMNLVRWILAQ